MMKKLFLFLTLLAGTIMSHANQITVINLSPCSYFVYLYEGEGYVYVTPVGTTNATQSFADPSLVPGSTAPPTAIFNVATIRRDNFTDAFSVGEPPLASSSFVSSFISDYPSCNMGNAYTVTWNSGGIGTNAVLLIMP